jgi:hypothetical protein
MKSAQENSGGDKGLGFSVVGPVHKVRVVYFHFRPEFFIHVNLKGVVPGKGSTYLRFISGRQGDPKGALDVEPADSLPVGNRRGDDGVGGTVFVLAGGESNL